MLAELAAVVSCGDRVRPVTARGASGPSGRERTAASGASGRSGRERTRGERERRRGLRARAGRGPGLPGSARVRLGDASPGGRLRFDALVRYLQDVANDDTRDAGFDDVMGWVVRRTEIEVRRFPVYLEPIALSTWCSGVGGRWAERRVHVAGEGGGRVEAATLWVHLDPDTMRPKVLPESFHALFGPSALGRTVRARLQHAEAPEDEDAVAARHTFPLRFTDFDVLNHVNNAVYWEVVEEELARRRELRAPLRAELEHRAPIEPGSGDQGGHRGAARRRRPVAARGGDGHRVHDRHHRSTHRPPLRPPRRPREHPSGTSSSANPSTSVDIHRFDIDSTGSSARTARTRYEWRVFFTLHHGGASGNATARSGPGPGASGSARPAHRSGPTHCRAKRVGADEAQRRAATQSSR